MRTVKASQGLGKKLAEYVKQINGTEDAMLGRNMLETFLLKLSPGKLFSTLLLVRLE